MMTFDTKFMFSFISKQYSSTVDAFDIPSKVCM